MPTNFGSLFSGWGDSISNLFQSNNNAMMPSVDSMDMGKLGGMNNPQVNAFFEANPEYARGIGTAGYQATDANMALPTQQLGMFQGFSDMLGSDAFKNIGNLGLGVAKYGMTKSAYKDEKAKSDELMAQRREDRAYNKERQERTSQLRF